MPVAYSPNPDNKDSRDCRIPLMEVECTNDKINGVESNKMGNKKVKNGRQVDGSTDWQWVN